MVVVFFCHRAGVCLRRWPEDLNVAHASTQSVPYGGLRHEGFCLCKKGYQGRFCESFVSRKQYCNGHGTPLCSAAYADNFPTSQVSINTNQKLNLYICNRGKLPYADQAGDTPGERGCNCELGYGPDIAGTATGHCAVRLPCVSATGVSQGLIGSDGYCRCFGDLYDLRSASDGRPGLCAPSCKQTICSGHGTCQPSAGTNEVFNSQCVCDSGWTTSAESATSNAGATLFQNKRYCDLPVEVFQNQVLSCGFYAVYNPAVSGLCELKAEYQSLQATEFYISVTTGLYTRKCYTPASGNYKNQQCHGALFGQCVSDSHDGFECKCRNGFKGTRCDQPTCPRRAYVNGAVCSGNGYCTSIDGIVANGRCVCKPGYYGEACEKRALDCSASQNVYSNPSIQALIGNLLDTF